MTNTSHCKGLQGLTGPRNHKDGQRTKDSFRNQVYKISYTDQNSAEFDIQISQARDKKSPFLPINLSQFFGSLNHLYFYSNKNYCLSRLHLLFSNLHIPTIFKLCLLKPIKMIMLVKMSSSYCLLWHRMWFKEPFILGLPWGQRLSANTLLQ